MTTTFLPPTREQAGGRQNTEGLLPTSVSLRQTSLSLYLEYLVLYLLNLEKAW